MSDTFHGWAALRAKDSLQQISYQPGLLGVEDVQIRVESCGICHSDLSMIDNDWGNSVYPLVAGHEVIGTIEQAGERVKGLAVGDRVGLGWFAGSCMSCRPCLQDGAVFSFEITRTTRVHARPRQP